MLLVASETGHVYTFATPKLQPMITSEAGKALIQTCLHTPEHSQAVTEYDMRMSVSGYEETDLGYSMNEDDGFKVCEAALRAGIVQRVFVWDLPNAWKGCRGNGIPVACCN